MSRIFNFSVVILLLLVGCSTIPAATEAAVISGPTNPTMPSEVKVVEMATQTPAPPMDATPTAEVTAPGPVAPTQAPSLADLGIDVKTYQDDQVGLAIDYPAAWNITVPPAEAIAKGGIYTISLRSSNASAGPKQQDGIAPGVAAVDATVFLDRTRTLDEALSERRSQVTQEDSGGPVKILAEEEMQLKNGLKAHRFVLQSGDQTITQVVMVHNGRMLLVSGFGDQSLFNSVVGSIRENP